MRSVAIDHLPESALNYQKGYAVVAVDVVRATTTAITAVATGRRCFPVASLDEAHDLAARMPGAILAGEQGGLVPPGFELNNSPATLAVQGDVARPVILLSSAGTRLCSAAAACDEAQLACLRNYRAVAYDLASRNRRVAIIGAGTRGEFREEDAMCCAWIAELLVNDGYRCENEATMRQIHRWSRCDANAWITGPSAAYLRRSQQLHDLQYVLGHVDDLRSVYRLIDGEVVAEDVTHLPAFADLGRVVYA